jgi:hypothetical protein
MAAYEESESMPEEPLYIGNGVMFVLVYEKGPSVGVTDYVEQRTVSVMVWVDGLLDRQVVYPLSDTDEARGAAERLAQERADG